MKNILHSPLFGRFPEIINATSTKDFGPLSFIYNKNSNSVIIDRMLFLETLGLEVDKCVLIGEQNHTSNILKITDDHTGHGFLDQSKQIPNIDGMVTSLENTHLVVYTADCMPISFYDPVKKIIGIAHSGWKGTIQGISEKMLDIFVQEYGSEVSDIYISVGPSIGPCCYAVKNPEQLDLFDKKYHNLIKCEDIYFVDLWDSIRQDILSLGILEEHYENPRICTSCNHHLYASHRRDNPNTTTNLSVISMKTE